MSDGPDNLMLAILRRMETKLDRVADDMADIKVRVTAMEEAVVGVHRRLDRMDARLDRVERRLDLSETVG